MESLSANNDENQIQFIMALLYAQTMELKKNMKKEWNSPHKIII